MRNFVDGTRASALGGVTAPKSESVDGPRAVSAVIFVEGSVVTLDNMLPTFYLTTGEDWEEALDAGLLDELDAVIDGKHLLMTNLRTRKDGSSVKERWYVCRVVSISEVDGRLSYLNRSDVESSRLLDLDQSLTEILLKNWPQD